MITFSLLQKQRTCFFAQEIAVPIRQLLQTVRPMLRGTPRWSQPVRRAGKKMLSTPKISRPKVILRWGMMGRMIGRPKGLAMGK